MLSILSVFNRLRHLPQSLQQNPVSIIAQPKPNTGAGLDVFTGTDSGEFAIVRYPPFDKGIPTIAPDKLIQAQEDLLERVRRSAGVTREHFEAHYKRPIEALARYLHLLPATSTAYFRGTGGLFRMSVEIGLYALQSANAGVFPTGNVERRHSMLPKWELATFLAGLCSQCYRTLNSVSVLTRENEQWQPLLEPLYDWCDRHDADVYFVRWMDDQNIQGEKATSAYAIHRIVPPEVLQYLSEENNQVVQAMTAAIIGVVNTSQNPIARLVAPIITRVVEAEQVRTATNYGHLIIGSHLEPHLLDAMRRLVRNGQWIPNNTTSGGRLWCGKDGVYIDWIPASRDIVNLLAKDGYSGVPKDPDTLADLLEHAKLLKLDQDGKRYWAITLPEVFEVREGMVKLDNEAMIFPQGHDMRQFEKVHLSALQRKTMPSANSTAHAKPFPSPARIPKLENEPPFWANKEHIVHRGQVEQKDDFPPQVVESPPMPLEAMEEPLFELQTEDFASPPPSPAQTSAKPKQFSRPLPAPVKERGLFANKEGKELTAEDLLAALKKPNADLLAKVIQAKQENTLRGQIVELEQGTGITMEELTHHGTPPMGLIQELSTKRWLYVDPTKPTKNVHVIKRGGNDLHLLILKTELAEVLGLRNAAA